MKSQHSPKIGCQARLASGPRAGDACGRQATGFVLGYTEPHALCGIHFRTRPSSYVPPAYTPEQVAAGAPDLLADLVTACACRIEDLDGRILALQSQRGQVADLHSRARGYLRGHESEDAGHAS